MVANLGTFTPDWTAAPQKTIARIMSRRGLSVYELAVEMDVSEAKAEALLYGGLQIDESLAERLSSALGATAKFWLNRETQYREDLQRLQKANEAPAALDQNWAKLFPIKDMIKFGWLPSNLSRQNYDAALREFFEVTTPQAWQQRYSSATAVAAFRTSPTFDSNPAAVTAWLRWAEIQADGIDCESWSAETLSQILPEMRALTRRNNPSKFVPELQNLCRQVGIALIIAPAPKGCKASGATRFVSPKKAYIALSLRYKSDDHFWFTFFHEIGHLVLHAKDALFLEDSSDISSVEEEEANRFSEEVLIPPAVKPDLLRLRPRTKDILRFAVKIGVSSGIVVGQLQHFGQIGRHQMNHLKRPYSWKEFEQIV
jgi:HTH-type transcriptional regulator / antitoxin HigA